MLLNKDSVSNELISEGLKCKTFKNLTISGLGPTFIILMMSIASVVFEGTKTRLLSLQFKLTITLITT